MLPSSSGPQANARGQNPGTESAMAFSDSYSPRNISSAALPFVDVLIKYLRSSSGVPVLLGILARRAAVLVNPDPRPEVDRLIDGSERDRARMIVSGTAGILIQFLYDLCRCD